MDKSETNRKAPSLTIAQCAAGIVVTACAVVSLASVAHAGTTGTEFQGAYDTIMDIADGYGGKLVALAAFSAGLIGGIARQSPMIFGSAAATSVAVAVGPGIVDSLVGALV